MNTPRDTRRLVKEAYGSVAAKQSSCCPATSSCCSGAAVGKSHPVPGADLGLSCGEPVAFSHLKTGDVVLDLGSGGGRDVFVAAQTVGPTGRAIGVDMTPEMTELARRNAEKFRQATGMTNVEFRQGEIEALPVEDASVDVVISNCVINLSPDKRQVFREIHRVLKPGGTMVVSDIVLTRPLPEDLRDDEDLYTACVAGALLRDEYLRAIRQAGFQTVDVLTERMYDGSRGKDDPTLSDTAHSLDGVAASITVRAAR
ncbi:MAG: arsenite methyltransferase [Planctomycetota bacterium]